MIEGESRYYEILHFVQDDRMGKSEDDRGGKGEASWCTKDFFVWYCWLMGWLGWGLSWFAGDLHVFWEVCDG